MSADRGTVSPRGHMATFRGWFETGKTGSISVWPTISKSLIPND
jgi:hypothetical protein